MSNSIVYDTVIATCQLPKDGTEVKETTVAHSSCSMCSAFGKGCPGSASKTHDAGTQA